MDLSSIRIVLVRPEEPGNVGAAARAMANFGLRHLVLVAPRTRDLAGAWKWAKGAEDVLEGADWTEDLAAAVAPCTRVWATTRRRGRRRGGNPSPEAAAVETVSAARSGRPTAWVFGPESRGLTTREVELCSSRITIPTAPEQPSLNLAQAVAVSCYEIRRAALGPGKGAEKREAPVEERQAMYGHLEEALLDIGFLHPHTAAARMAALRDVFERARLTSREVRMLRGLARQASWAGTGRKRR